MKQSRWLSAVLLIGCGSQPTLQQAQAGLRLACDALAVATAAGTTVPAEELARQACDTERTSAIMAELVARAARNELVAEPPDWVDELSPAPARDAGAAP